MCTIEPLTGDCVSYSLVMLSWWTYSLIIYCTTQFFGCPGIHSSAKCKSVRKPHTYLPDTPVAPTSASKYFQMLPGPPGALQCALRLCKSILRCSLRHLQGWRCIQDATRLTIRIVKCWSCWDLCAGLQETSRAAETSAQVWGRLCEQLRPLRKFCGRLGAIFSQQWFRAAAAAAGSISVHCFFHFRCINHSTFIGQRGWRVVAGGAPPCCWPARRRRGHFGPVIL